jgi:ubiquinone/menaquinone biosynthesis C-methylase UbiE
MGEVLLVLGAQDGLVAKALAEAGEEGTVIVVDPSGARLVELEERLRDPRLWFLVGDREVIPLPDRSVDRVLGAPPSPEVRRVCR